MLRFRCVVLVQDYFILTRSQKTPYVHILRAIHPPIQSAPGLFPKVKTAGHETNHSPPSFAKVRNSCRYTSTLPILLYVRKTSSNPLPLSSMLYYTENPFPSYPSICCLYQYKFFLHVFYMLYILYHILK